jgi:HSP20 family protein
MELILNEPLFAISDWAPKRRRGAGNALATFGDAPSAWPLASFRAGIEAPQILVNVVATKDAYQIRAEIAGVDKKDCKIRIDKGVLTISGEKKSESEQGDPKSTYSRKEAHFGSFSRSLTLPPDASADVATAKMENGVLTIELKKLEHKELPGRELAIE